MGNLKMGHPIALNVPVQFIIDANELECEDKRREGRRKHWPDAADTGNLYPEYISTLKTCLRRRDESHSMMQIFMHPANYERLRGLSYGRRDYPDEKVRCDEKSQAEKPQQYRGGDSEYLLFDWMDMDTVIGISGTIIGAITNCVKITQAENASIGAVTQRADEAAVSE